jgi:phosphatidylglycerol lysyltransferase
LGRDPSSLERARQLVLAHGFNPTAYQILNPGIELWFSDTGHAVAGYVDRSGVRVVAGNPVCPPEELEAVVEELETACRRQRLRFCFLGADPLLHSLFATSGSHASIVVGAHPIVDPARWSHTLEHHHSLRAQLNRARNKSVTVEEWPATEATNHPELRHCLGEWLRARGLPPLHFLVEPDTLGSLADRCTLVARRGERVVGFLVASPVPRKNGWQIEHLVRGDAAPNGSMELLVDGALRRLGAGGARYVALGAAPLSSRAPRDPTTPKRLAALLAWQRAHGRRFYNFEGLERFKAKFWPDQWEPVHAISDEPRFSVGTMYAIAGAYCAGSPFGTLLRAMARAARQEGVWLWNAANHPARRATR